MPKADKPSNPAPLPQRLHEAWMVAVLQLVSDGKISGDCQTWDGLEEWKREGYRLMAVELVRAGVITLP